MMPHFRKRHALKVFENVIKFSPLVGIFGHRQVGKTTFLEKIVDSYYTFDDKKTKLEAIRDSSVFINKTIKKPAAIDECQIVEDLFPALKEYVRKHKKPGQIILSGSVRFYSRAAIRESLTGRIANIDLLPMVLTELIEEERSEVPLKLIQRNSFSHDFESILAAKECAARTKQIQIYLKMGGLPGICFLRNERIRSEKLKEQLLLILDRDLRLVYPSSVPYVQILDFVKRLSEQEGEPFQPTVLRKLTGLAEATQKKLLHALEAVFLVRLLSIEGDRKGVCAFFEDQAEHLFLHEEKIDPLKSFEGLVYRNLRASFYYEMGLGFRFFQFRTRSGARIPFAVKTKDGCLGILPILSEKPSRADFKSAHLFLQRYSPATVLIVTMGQSTTRVLEPRILQIPAEQLLY